MAKINSRAVSSRRKRKRKGARRTTKREAVAQPTARRPLPDIRARQTRFLQRLGVIKSEYEKRKHVEQRKHKRSLHLKWKNKSSGFVKCHKEILKAHHALRTNDVSVVTQRYMKARTQYVELSYSEKVELYPDLKQLYTTVTKQLSSEMNRYNSLVVHKPFK